MLLPLFPLPGVVLFPGARLPLHVFEPRYRRLVADLLELPEAERRIGLVYAARMQALEAEELLEPGCAGRLVEHVPLAGGRSNIVLAGEFRFRIERELACGPHRPYRMAEVTRLAEPLPLLEHERAERAGSDLLALAAAVVRRGGESSPIELAELAGLGAVERLPELANRLAARLDLPPLRKLSLLALDPLERAEEVAGILRSRVKLLDCLSPYRLLGCEPALN